MSHTYLDYAATSPLLPAVVDKMQKTLVRLSSGELANPSALHQPGHLAQELIEQARASVARLINAEPEEIIFTSGGSEANNTVTEIFRGKNQIISAIEHPSLLESAKKRAGNFSAIQVDQDGLIDVDQVTKQVEKINQMDQTKQTGQTDSTCPAKAATLVSVMLANNELGTVEPIADMAGLLTNYQNIYLHSDATQALGKMHIDVKKLGVDYLTLSSHKIGGPVGVGALYVRKGSPYRPLIIGGHQEQGRRAGTSNVLLITGFGTAAQWCWDHWSCKAYLRVAKLRNQLKDAILSQVPYSSTNGIADCFYDETTQSFNTLPNILNMSFQASEGESIQLYLDANDIAVSTGSACAAGDIKPSHVIMATTHDAEVAHSSIRFSLGLDTTAADIEKVITTLPGIIKRLQGISTIKIKENI